MKNNTVLAFVLIALFFSTSAFAAGPIDDSGCDDCLAIHLSEEMVADGYGSCPSPAEDVRGYFGLQDSAPQTDVERSIELSKEKGAA